ncbi:MAG: DNA recombination protein RmuC [bacterium]
MITIYSLITGLIGLIMGGAIAWLVAKLHSQRKINELEKIGAGLETIVKERDNYAKDKDCEIDRLRNELNLERQSRVEASTRLEEAQKILEEEKKFIETIKEEMRDTFNALSSASLKSSSEDFLRLASEHLGKVVADTKGKLGEHQAAMDGLIKPLQEALKKYEEQIHSIEIKRKEDYGSLNEQIKMLSASASNLTTALRKPHIRGRWGETALRNVVELAGMSSYVDFIEQVVVKDEDIIKRPDMVIRLPGGRSIVVDSKVSIDALLDASSCQSEEEKREFLKKHSQHVKEQIMRLSEKAYWEQFEKSPEIAVLFMGESSFVQALEIDPTLMEFGLSKKVLVATPITLFALLRAINYGLREEQLTKNAQIISELGKQLYERINVLAGHFEDIGSNLTKATEAYNKGVSSLETRVLPSIRRFKDLGISVTKEIPIIEPVEKLPRNTTLLLDNLNE